MTTFSAAAYINDACFSDLFKDINGWRPRGQIVERWLAMNEAELDAEQDRMIAELNDVMADEDRAKAEAARVFEARVADMIAIGAADRATAIRWIADAENCADTIAMYGDMGYLEYSLGLAYGYLKA